MYEYKSSMVSGPHRKLPAAASGRRERRKQELQARILRAALDLFGRQGFFDTTIEQITEAADVGKGTFFNYFPSKEHVLAGFGELQVGRIHAAIADYDPQAPTRGVLHRLMFSLAEAPGRSPALVRSILVANFSSQDVRRLFRRHMRRGRHGLARLIAEGQRRGEIRSDLSPAELSWSFMKAFFGTLVLWALHPPSRLETWVEPSFRLFWEGIAAPPGAPKNMRRQARRPGSRKKQEVS